MKKFICAAGLFLSFLAFTIYHVSSLVQAESSTLPTVHHKFVEKAKMWPPDGTAGATDELLVLARRRKTLLAEILKNNDIKTFYAYALTDELRDRLPESLKESGLIEKKVAGTGKLSVVHADDFETHRFSYFYEISPAPLLTRSINRSFNFYLDTKSPPAQSGSIVSIAGLALDNTLALQNPADLKVVTAAAPLGTTGKQLVAGILFNFQNDTSQPVAKDDFYKALFTNANASHFFYRENSHDQLILTGDVFGYVTIPMDKGECRHNEWADAADATVSASGVNLDLYHRRVYVFPYDASCPYGAWGSLGGDPSRAWIQGSGSPSYLFTHELGHNLGLSHASAYECGDKQIGDSSKFFSECTHLEYGDAYDIMGGASFHNYFNGPHRYQLGWLKPAEITTVYETGLYTLSHLQSTDSNLKLLRIPIANTQKYYYVGYKRPWNFDSGLPNNITRGATIHLWDETYKNSWAPTWLLDTTPQSQVGDYGYYSGDFSDSALANNASFIDPYNKISITQIFADENKASVAVNLNSTIIPFPTPTTVICSQVITYSRNLVTYACQTFTSSCLPLSWVQDDSCRPTPTSTPTPTPLPTATPTPTSSPIPTNTPTPTRIISFVFHAECQNTRGLPRCVQVFGPGTNQCQTNADCLQTKLITPTPQATPSIQFHSECRTRFGIIPVCQAIPGPGNNSCNNIFDCLRKK